MFFKENILILLFAAIALSACGNNQYLLKTKFVQAQHEEDKPDVTTAMNFLELRGQIHSVAIQAPTKCNSTGDQTNAAGALATFCGVEIAEIERGLTKKGLKVISWSALSHELNRNANSKDIPSRSIREIAVSLGADAILQINQFEKILVKTGKDSRLERRYFETDAYGKELGEAVVDKGMSAAFKFKLLDLEKSINVKGERPAVAIDAVLTDAKSNESFWFYRWTHVESVSSEIEKKAFVTCEKDEEFCVEYVGDACKLKTEWKCTDFAPKEDADEKDSGKVSGDTVGVSDAAESEKDRIDASHKRLTTEVISDLVNSFTK